MIILNYKYSYHYYYISLSVLLGCTLCFRCYNDGYKSEDSGNIEALF